MEITDEKLRSMREHLTMELPDAPPVVIDATLRHAASKLRENPVWLSGTHQVNIIANRDGVHYSLKTRDRAPIINRDDLIDIAQHFNRSRRDVCCELYPAESRVVDTANQYHLWQIRVPREIMAAIPAALDRPNTVVPIGPGLQLLHIPLGAQRDWREVQSGKNSRMGDEIEALDLMLPATRQSGPLLLVYPEGVAAPVGWKTGLRLEGSLAGGHQQRPFDQADTAP